MPKSATRSIITSTLPSSTFDTQHSIHNTQSKMAQETNGEDLQSFLASIYGDNPQQNYVVAKLTDSSKGKDGLEAIYVGTGGLNELKEKLADHEKDIMFFLLLVNTVDEEGSSRAKFLYGRFVGSKVPFMQKAKLTPQLGDIADQFQVKHVSMDADEEMKGWQPEALAKEFLRIGGAHKPSQYVFGPDAVYNCN